MSNDKKVQVNEAELDHDNSHLYFLLGALSSAYRNMSDNSKREYINSLKEKEGSKDPDDAEHIETLRNFRHAMERE